MSIVSKKQDHVFATKPRRLSAEDILKVAGGGPYEGLSGKSGSGQDNQAKPGFAQ